MLSIGRDKNGNVTEETRDHPAGPVTSRTVRSTDGSVTVTSNGGQVGIQAANVDDATVVNGKRVR